MVFQPLHYGLLVALAIALIWAAYTDMRSRTISNKLNLAIALGAPLFWISGGLSVWPGMATQLGLALAAFVVLAGLFALRAMGGGDVKMLTALALWFAPLHFAYLLIAMALFGGLMTIVMGVYHIMRRERNKLKIPYGIAIAFGGFWVLIREYLPAAMKAFGFE